MHAKQIKFIDFNKYLLLNDSKSYIIKIKVLVRLRNKQP